MPYAQDYCGIYKISNNVTGQCYVGQSQRVKKRIKEHFRLLRLGKHPNQHLQNSYSKYGEDAFSHEIEVLCEDLDEMDMLEEAFIKGEAFFEHPATYNIANFAKAPMRGRKHSEETKLKISKSKILSGFDYKSESWRQALKEGQLRRTLENKELCKMIKFIIENPHLSYAERARIVGTNTSSARKLFLRYKNKKDLF